MLSLQTPDHKTMPPANSLRRTILRAALLLATALVLLCPASAQLQAHTVTALSTTAARFPYGSPITLSVAVTPASATGRVTLTDNAQPLTTLTLVDGAASFTSTTFALGAHRFAAAYAGDPADAPSSTPILPITIDRDPDTLTLSAEPLTAPWTSLPPLTVTAHPASATGLITLTDTAGSTPVTLATASLTPDPLGSTALFSLVSLPPGLHTLTATYPGDLLNLGATSSTLTVNVTSFPAAVTLRLTPSPSIWGQPVSLIAGVSPSTDFITFTDTLDGALGQADVNPSGLAIFHTSTLSVGLHTISATFPADAFHTLASTTQTLLVTAALTVTTLGPIAATIPTASPITLTAAIAPASATGSLTFRDSAIGTLGQAAVLNGIATLTLPSLNPGPHTLVAAYAGSATLAPSLSAPVSTTITLDTSVLILSISPANPRAAQPVTFTVSAQPPSLTGLITFSDGQNPIGHALLQTGTQPGSQAGTPSATATFTCSTLTPGLHTLLATSSGDPTHAPATSVPQILSIAQNPTSLTLTLAQNPIPADLPISVNLHVTAPWGSPTGTLALRSGASILASTTLSALQSGAATLTLPGTLAPGTYTLIASYSGDPANLPADTSATPVLLTVTPIPTSGTLEISASSAFPNTAVTLTATVSTTSSALIPTGTVQFLRDGTPIASAPLTPQGTTSTLIPSLPLGTSTFLAQFQAINPFAPATLGPASLNVAQPFALALNPAAITVAPASSGTTTLTLTPLAGFTGSVALACSSSQPFLTCTVSPENANLTSAAAVSSTVTVTAVPSTLALNRTTSPVLPTLAVAALTLLILPIRRRPRATLTLLAALTLPLASCGWGGTLNQLPPGIYAITLTASGANITLPATLSVNVLATQ